MDERKMAVAKLQEEFEKGKELLEKDIVAKVIAHAVKDRLISFCEQSTSFSRKVLRKVQTITDCINSIAEPISKERKHGVSDLEVYAAAVKFYSETSKIECVFNFSCDEESEEVTDEEFEAVKAEQQQIEAQRTAEKAAKEAERKAEEERRKAQIEARQQERKQAEKAKQENIQLSLFDL